MGDDAVFEVGQAMIAELQDDPDNFRHAHFNCNSSRGKGEYEQGVGEEMPAWW